MKLIISTVFFLNLNSLLRSDVIIAQTFDSDFNKTFIWKISSETYESLTEIDWNKNPNLDLAGAVNKAIVATSKKYPDKKIVADRISIIRPITAKEKKNIYFYDITLDIYNSKNLIIRSTQVIMFLNGEIIESVQNP